MYRRIPYVIFLEQLGEEYRTAEKLLQGIDSVMLRTDVEYCFVLVISHFEVVFSAVKVLLKHGYIVILQSVKQW